MVSYVLGVVTFIAVILYLVQFVIYTKNYLQRQTKNFTYSAADTGILIFFISIIIFLLF